MAGLPPNSHCSKCSDKYALDDKCVRSCPIDTYSVTYRDKGSGCRRCSSKLNEILNPERTGCIQSPFPLNATTHSRSLPIKPVQKVTKKAYVSKTCNK